MRTETFNIEGMNCGHCTAMVKKSLEILRGVHSADVTLGSATVVYDEQQNTRGDLAVAITRFGYKVLDYQV